MKELKPIASNSENVQILPLDLTKTDELESITKNAIALFGHIDLLINNGGISQRSLIADTNLEVDRRVMEVNYFGTIALTKALLPHFIERKSGYFAVVTSAVGIITTRYRSGYAASKHALHGFFDTLRIEHHDDNISVSIILPGFIQTPITMHALTADGSPQEKMDKVTEEGMPANVCAARIVKALARKKEEVYIAGVKEKFAIYMKRFWPTMFSKLIRNARVT